jgi:1,4-alpha-glucan branching enzyme
MAMRWPSLSAFAITVLAALISVACATTLRPAPPTASPSGVRFVFEHAAARSVFVAGTFNAWSASSHPLMRDRASGLWVGVVPMATGEHLFMYIVNGTEWITPPRADDYLDDGFGSRNGVIVVRPPGN